MMKENEFTTGEGRMSYVHLTQPYAFQPGSPERYSVTFLLPKTDTATKARIDAAIAAATQKGVQDKWNGQRPPVVADPMWDGDAVKSDGTPFGPECKGCWVFTASAPADRKPELVDERCNPIIDASAIYSGMFGRVNVAAFPYFNSGKRGIGFSLQNVMKTKDGEPLGGSRTSAAEAFGVPAPSVDPISGRPLV